MVWSGTTKVAFGIKGKYVVAWYCDIKGNANGVTASATEPAATYKQNVGTNCLQFYPVDRTMPVQMYNKCYNER